MIAVEQVDFDFLIVKVFGYVDADFVVQLIAVQLDYRNVTRRGASRVIHNKHRNSDLGRFLRCGNHTLGVLGIDHDYIVAPCNQILNVDLLLRHVTVGVRRKASDPLLGTGSLKRAFLRGRICAAQRLHRRADLWLSYALFRFRQRGSSARRNLC